ncbi:TPR repeat-containing protein [Methanolobus psychrophilus R15]|nr:TPR repeat-containing protein [Methanolobus psychrophilus R15]
MESDTPEEWFKLAFDAEEPEEKIEYFDLILECETRDPVLWSDEALALIWNNKGIAYTFMGMYEESMECFERSLKYNKSDTEVWYNMGVALFNLRRFEESIRCYNRILALDSRNDNAWINKGDVLAYTGRHREAIECYSKVHKDIELDCKFAIVWNKKGLAYLDLGLYENAAECFSKVLSIDPEHADAIENMRLAMEEAKMKNGLAVQAHSQIIRQ